MAAGGGDHGNQHAGGKVAGKEILPYPAEKQGQSRDQAAALVGVSGRYVSDVKAISQKAPELLQEIEAQEDGRRITNP